MDSVLDTDRAVRVLFFFSLSGFSPWPGSFRCFWRKHLLSLCLLTQMYKWVEANLLLGITLRWTSIPSANVCVCVCVCVGGGGGGGGG